MSDSAEIVRRHRARHPERARLQSKITNARQAAARTVALRHPREYELEIAAECERRGIPRYLPPLPPLKDARRIKARR